MKTLFLICALALPEPNLRADYMLLKQYIETRWPEYWVVFVNENEQLLMPKKDGFIHVKSNGTDREFLHLWLLKRDA